MFTPTVMLNKHLEKVMSNEKHPGKKLGFAFCISPLSIIKWKKNTSLQQIPMYYIIISFGENISIFTCATHS